MMRSSLWISLGIHVVISLIAFNWVSFRQVDYVPRDTYMVSLISPEPVQAKPILKPEPKPAPPEPPPPDPEPEPEEEMAPPPEKPKPLPKPKPEKKPKTIPKTEITEKREPAAETTDTAEQPAPETGAVTLDAEDFPFSHYISRMRAKIAARWRVPPGGKDQDRHCRIYFRVLRNGQVTAVSVEQSSGLFMFDQAAQRSVLAAAPMPPLPREYRDSYLGVHFSFAFRQDN